MDSESKLLEESSASSSSSSSGFDRDRHVTFLELMYQLLPSQYQTQEINHLTLAYFVISSLDLLGAMDRVGTIFHFSLYPVVLIRVHIEIEICVMIECLVFLISADFSC